MLYLRSILPLFYIPHFAPYSVPPPPPPPLRPGDFINGVTTARAGVHSDARKAMVTLCLHLVRIAAKSHPDLRHLPDLFRAAKAAMRDMELKDVASVFGFVSSAIGRLTIALR